MKCRPDGREKPFWRRLTDTTNNQPNNRGKLRQMAKAYRTNVLGKKKFQEEIQQRRSALQPERVPWSTFSRLRVYLCEMYGCKPANLVEYTAILQGRVGAKANIPGHTQRGAVSQ